MELISSFQRLNDTELSFKFCRSKLFSCPAFGTLFFRVSSKNPSATLAAPMFFLLINDAFFGKKSPKFQVLQLFVHFFISTSELAVECIPIPFF